jgi:opacity protein-like surface antigen
MTKTLVRASLFALLSSIGGTAAAQTPPGAPPAVAPAPAPAPAAPPGYPPAPSYSTPPGAPLAPSPLYAPPPGPAAPQYGMPMQDGMPMQAVPSPPEGTAAYVNSLMVGAAWDIGIPVGSVHDFTSNVSPVGFDISLRYWFHPRLSIGAEVEWQTYRDDKPRTTYQVTDGAVTATAYNSLQAGSLRATMDFYLLDRGPVLPFVGASVGYGWSTFQSAAADIQVYDNQDSVVAGAELGALVALSPRAPLLLVAGRYSGAPSMEFYKIVKDVQAITLQVGVLLY